MLCDEVEKHAETYSAMSETLDWLIIGGGIHGTHLSLILTARAGVPRERVRVLDPHTEPLAEWKRLTATTGMDSLRSPGVHQLDIVPRSLFAFAKTPAGRALPQPKGVYGRPPLALFHAHSEGVIASHTLAALRLIGRAQRLERTAHGWRVETSNGAMTARRVLLAISAAEQPHWPAWARQLQASDAPIDHIFADSFVLDTVPSWRHVVVVGGGITAVQLALRLAAHQPGTVTLLQRHAPRKHLFDSDPCWMGPKCLKEFGQIVSYQKRRTIIREARHRGSVPDYVATRLRIAITTGAIRHCIDAVAHAAFGASGMHLQLAQGDRLNADQVVLATGFEPRRPGGAWLDHAIAAHDLPCASCGYPIVDRSLCWRDGLYVTGPLAELELGPAARNIVGARHAGVRLAAAC